MQVAWKPVSPSQRQQIQSTTMAKVGQGVLRPMQLCKVRGSNSKFLAVSIENMNLGLPSIHLARGIIFSQAFESPENEIATIPTQSKFYTPCLVQSTVSIRKSNVPEMSHGIKPRIDFKRSITLH
eukprot:gnl/MRDRNA2_/MRDRNA2_85530_c0_seq2.p1 gnl/MRDRNA2_/MRDRNA2_85530_c0~~gnl/MRDRNA2_/MRDRNA2_85530_c0_seq2.p1  ORF type:complete len:125 (-),score=14.10 gnl/MRDRNA2_/MRDRNA2_85530_c0_seq2:201-575(-)